MQSYLKKQIQAVLDGMEGVPDGFEPEFQQPANPEHGDIACNAALQLARPLKQSPRRIAEAIRDALWALPVDPEKLAAIEVAGPGFLNFRYASSWLAVALAGILENADAYGRTADGKGKKALVEFVSANPTGPLTVGHGRNAVLGDTIANLLDWTGYQVEREYYFNDAGRQMRVLGESVKARYVALVNPAHPTRVLEDGTVVPDLFPEDGYLGDYIADIALELKNEFGNTLVEEPGSADVFTSAAEKRIFREIETTLDRMGIRMDSYFNERSLYESNRVWEVVDSLRKKNLAYDKDGAIWLRTTEWGKEQDTVLVKSSGEPTYRLPDIAYHVDKLERGYDRVVDVFGADHIATFPDVLHGVQALGHDIDRIQVIIYQFVTLVRGGEPVKMSTRKATYVTLDELMDEVGEDVTRFFFLMRSPNTHLEFDLDLAREASEKNPVFYLQYAHARIASIVRKAKEEGFSLDHESDLGLLSHEAEVALIKSLVGLPEAVTRSAESMEPHRLATYLREVAVAFTRFYGHCRIIGEEAELAGARLKLALATGQVLRNGLTILGISAPERM